MAIGSLVASSVAMTMIVLVAGPASAAAAKSPAKSGTKSAAKLASRYGVINGTVNAATDHEIAGTSAFPNFANGAIDNYYSLAHSGVDNSPFAEGTSSPLDTGPIGQTVAAGNFAQPQYADARWPGKNSGKASFGNQGGPYAVAAASAFTATASCTEASNGSGGMATPKGFTRRLRLALKAWKAIWLPRLKTAGLVSNASLTVPTVTTPTLTGPSATTPTVTTPTVSTPTVTVPGKTSGSHSRPRKRSRSSSSGDGGALLGSSTSVTLDPKTGALVTKGESSLGRVSLGGGQIVIDSIDVAVTVTNNGKPTDKVAIAIGAASIGGVPVTIDQDGVHINGQGSGLPYGQADDALNTALKQAGIALFTVVPEIKKSPNAAAVTATGVHVAFTQPVQAAGVPAQFVEHILGEVFVNSLAAPAPPLPKLKLGLAGTGGTTLAGGTGTSTGLGQAGGSTSSSFSSSPGSSSTGAGSASPTGPTVLTSLASKPLWLLIAYLVWQALMIGTGASLWRWRAGRAS